MASQLTITNEMTPPEWRHVRLHPLPFTGEPLACILSFYCHDRIDPAIRKIMKVDADTDFMTLTDAKFNGQRIEDWILKNKGKARKK
jgi:hypothetical protein